MGRNETSGMEETPTDDFLLKKIVGFPVYPLLFGVISVLNFLTANFQGYVVRSAFLSLVMVAADQTPEYSDVRNAGHDGGDFLFVRKK